MGASEFLIGQRDSPVTKSITRRNKMSRHNDGRFNGYNRGDYYYPRTSREAFGQAVSSDELSDTYARSNRLDRVVGAGAIVVAVLFFIFIW